MAQPNDPKRGCRAGEDDGVGKAGLENFLFIA
jgi:hypothetical protein